LTADQILEREEREQGQDRKKPDILKNVRLKGIQGGLETNGPYPKVVGAALIHIK
jgi:hypothetical protein